MGPPSTSRSSLLHYFKPKTGVLNVPIEQVVEAVTVVTPTPSVKCKITETLENIDVVHESRPSK